MNKSENPSSFPNSQEVGSRLVNAPSGVGHQPTPVDSTAGSSSGTPARPTKLKAAPEYVDPYLFEIGYYQSRAEYEELSRTAATRLQLRADVEFARPKRQRRPKP